MKEQLELFFSSELERYLAILEKMVSTNSYTENPAGVNKLGKLTADFFSVFGFTPDFVQSENPAFGKHLVLTRSGKSSKIIGLITHLDTVFSVEEERSNSFSWQRNGDRIYGPGTNDIKGGTVLILMVLEAINRFFPEVFDEISWVILANAAEERWSFDFGELCRQRLAGDAIAALVFEAGYYDENYFSLVTSRKGMAVYDIQVEGKSAHAGNGHAAGANALLQMASVIQKVSDLTDYERDLTFNVGVLNGGTVPNRVPHFAEARGEMRTFDHQVYLRAIDQLLDMAAIKPITSPDGSFSCNIDIQVIIKNPPWPKNEMTEQLFDLWQKTAFSMGMEVIREARGGLSDGNQLWDVVPTLDGLGPNGRNAHCSERTPDGSKDQEYVTISSFVPKAVLNTLAILKLISPKEG
jgi:glutamate carboxypeptidase